MTPLRPFSLDDLEALRAHGIDPDEALQQLERLKTPMQFRTLFGPALPGDGIELLAETMQTPIDSDRLVRFIPASGAATRMFRELREALSREASEEPPALVQDFFARLPKSALAEVAASVDATGRPSEAWHEQLTALLDRSPAALATRPKALIPFHIADGRVLTALEQQLREAARMTGAGHCRVHLTVSPAHELDFRRELAFVTDRIERDLNVSLEVRLSHQDPASDTIALDADGKLLRDDSGVLVFRPAGHGALIRNLDAIDADYLVIKNIDNIGTTERQIIGANCAKHLLHRLQEIERRVHRALRSLDKNTADRQELAAIAKELGRSPTQPTTQEDWITLLDRPLRVAGMVRNTGDAGGGPFHAADPDDPAQPSRQIVEQTEVNTDDPEQLAHLQDGTHFNPVFMAVSKRRFDGSRFELTRFIDSKAWLRVDKSAAGRPITALERPGLWNGAMARWNTLFVGVPAETFQPVKTIFDLLR
jgi:hypothetical protein